MPDSERESTTFDRDASIKRALIRLKDENERLKALVVSLSKLVIENGVGKKTDKKSN